MDKGTPLQYLTIEEFKVFLKEQLIEILTPIKGKFEDVLDKTEKEFVTINVVLERLHVTKPTVYNWIKKGLIKPKKMGGRVLFNLPEILNSISSNKYGFSKGRDYLHSNPEKINDYSILSKKYYSLVRKQERKGEECMTEEERRFINDFRSKYSDSLGLIRRA